jgi:uncharacterized membrane protein
MTQTLDINGTLISSEGEKHPCKLVNVSDKGYIELYSIDVLEAGQRLQLVINSPMIRTGLTVTAVESSGDTYFVEAIPEEPITMIQAKIVEQKVRGLMK